VNRDGFSVVDGPLVTIVRCDALAAVPGVSHGFSTRKGAGVEDFDLGRAAEQRGEHAGRHQTLLAASGLDGRIPLALEQVHGNAVLPIGTLVPGSLQAGDAIVALEADRGLGAPGVRYADCLPILLAERSGRAIAAIHAGWRGTALGIAGRAVAALASEGIPPASLVAGLGPAIGPCCYEVSDEVLERVASKSGVDVANVSRELPAGTRSLDLAEANRQQLIRSGLSPDSVYRAPWCTFCEKNLFFSHRRQGNPAGRMLGCIGWVPDPPLP
jgi:YfiH family protein